MIPIRLGKSERREVVSTYQDYCPLHRGVHDFDLEESRVGTHMNGISLRKGKLWGYVGVSKEICATAWAVESDDILGRTVEQRWSDRLETERQLRTSPLAVPVGVRTGLFHEAIRALIRARDVPETIGNRAAGRVFFPTLAILAVTLFAFPYLPETVANVLLYLIVAILLPGPSIAKARAESQYRRRVLDLVPGALQPLALPAEILQAEFQRLGRSAKPIERAFKSSNPQGTGALCHKPDTRQLRQISTRDLV